MTVTPLHPAGPRYPCIEDPRIPTTILKDGDAIAIVLSAHREVRPHHPRRQRRAAVAVGGAAEIIPSCTITRAIFL